MLSWQTCISLRALLQTDYPCSFVEMWDSYSVFGLGVSLRTNSAGVLRYVIAARDNKGLSVSTWRKKGGGLATRERGGGLLSSIQRVRALVWSGTRRWGNRTRGGKWEQRGSFCRVEDVFWHNDPCVLQFVIEWSVCRRAVGRGRFRGVIRVITHAW